VGPAGLEPRLAVNNWSGGPI